MSKTKIPWATKVWNPVTGCTYGCKYCYARKFANRLQSNPKAKHKYRNNFTPTFHWTELSPDRMKKFKKGDYVFVPSMGDLFDSAFSFQLINSVFLAMTYSQATFFVLTKQPQRMLDFYREYQELLFPIQNVWLGVSVTNQKDADERLPLLDFIPVANKFVSVEPLIFPVNLEKHICGNFSSLNWVIVGGENGQKAQPIISQWVSDIQKLCDIYNVPFFFKGWGEWMPSGQMNSALRRETYITNPNKYPFINYFHDGVCLEVVQKTGRKISGDFLYGKQYHEFPKI